jgi:prepilin-type N-terminal cleavage/methylation domain-containing protein
MLKLIQKRNNKKGFTLAELLIVVAIIAVLVAISIPIFTNQLEKAREATDMANIRAAYAEVVTAQLTDEEGTSKTVTLTQQKNEWQSDVKMPENLKSTDDAKQPTAGQTVTITATESGATIDILCQKQ